MLASLLIYTLMNADIDEKTYEFGNYPFYNFKEC